MKEPVPYTINDHGVEGMSVVSQEGNAISHILQTSEAELLTEVLNGFVGLVASQASFIERLKRDSHPKSRKMANCLSVVKALTAFSADSGVVLQTATRESIIGDVQLLEDPRRRIAIVYDKVIDFAPPSYAMYRQVGNLTIIINRDLVNDSVKEGLRKLVLQF